MISRRTMLTGIGAAAGLGATIWLPRKSRPAVLPSRIEKPGAPPLPSNRKMEDSMLPGIGGLAGFCMIIGSDQLTSFSFVTSGSGDSASKLIPATAQEGDLALLLDQAFSDGGGQPSTVVPTGFTSLVNTAFTGSNGGVRAIVSAKILAAGEPNTTVTGLEGVTRSRYIFFIFRPNAPLVSFTSNDVAGQGTSGNPSAQTITSGSAATKPVIPWAHIYSSNVISSKDGDGLTEVEGSGTTVHFGYYKIYSSSDTPANHTVDLGDSGGENLLQSGYLTFS